MDKIVFKNARVITDEGVLDGGCAAADGVIAGVWKDVYKRQVQHVDGQAHGGVTLLTQLGSQRLSLFTV